MHVHLRIIGIITYYSLIEKHKHKEKHPTLIFKYNELMTSSYI